MKTYHGIREGSVVSVTREGYSIPNKLDLVNHSPDGFEFGYGGSGPAQLALAILCDYLKDDTLALNLYQDFKKDVIAGLTGDQFDITEDQLNKWLYGKILKQRVANLKERIDTLKCT